MEKRPTSQKTDRLRKRNRTEVTKEFMSKCNNFTKFFVITSKSTTPMQDISPFPIAKAIKECISGDYDARKMNSGDLLIEVRNEQQSNNIRKLNKIGDHEVSVTPHRSLNHAKGVISDNDLVKCTDAEITEALADQGVLSAHNLMIRREGKEIRTRHVVLTFASTTLPSAVHAAYLHLKVRPYVPNPRRCFRCQRYGHGSQACRGKATCVKCGLTDHIDDECTNELRCINCEGPHAAYSRTCPVWKKEKQVNTLKVQDNISYAEARKRVEFAQKGSYSQAVQRGRVPQMVSVSTQVQLQDLVSALQPSRRESEGTQQAPSTRGLEAPAAAGTIQRSVEATQTSLTLSKGRLPPKKLTLSQSSSNDERPCGADSMEVCPADTEEVAAGSKPPRPPVVPPIPPGRGKGARHPVSAPGKGT